MWREFAAFRLEPDALHQAFVLGLNIEQGLCRGDTGDDRTWLAAAKRGQSLHVQLESAAFHASEHGRNLMRDVVIDVADEPQGQVIIFWSIQRAPGNPPRKVANACPTSGGISTPVKRRGMTRFPITRHVQRVP